MSAGGVRKWAEFSAWRCDTLVSHDALFQQQGGEPTGGLQVAANLLWVLSSGRSQSSFPQALSNQVVCLHKLT